jgi:CheW-like domain
MNPTAIPHATEPLAPALFFNNAADAPMPQTELKAPARLLEFDRGRHVALPVHTTIELIERPELVGVPGAAYYSLGMLAWQGQHLAVIDLCTLLNAHRKDGAQRPRHVLVVAYQPEPRQPVQHAAIATVSLPQTLQVGNGTQCPLPEDSDLWPLIAVSCFEHLGVRVPIIDTSRLFSSHWG